MVRVVLVCFLLMTTSGCGNPFGGGSHSSNIANGHDPLDEPSIPSDSNSTLIVSIPKDLIADNSTTNTVKVTIKTSDDLPVNGKLVTLTSSRGATDTITAVNATTAGSGVASFTVRSNTVGAATLTAGVPADSLTLTQTDKAYFFPEHPYIDMQGIFAHGTTPGENNPSGTTTWVNNGTGGVSLNGALSNFGLDASTSTSRWGGDGTTTLSNANDGQYRLMFDGVDDIVSLGVGFNSQASVSFDTWLMSDALTRGSVIMSNADATTKGLILRQRWDGQGGLTLSVGQSYADVITKDLPIGYWRLGESGSTFYNSGTASSIDGTKVAGVTNGATSALANDADSALTFVRPGDNNGAITVPDQIDLDGTQAMTIEAWVYLDASCAASICGIVSKRVASGTEEAYILYTDAKKLIFRVAGSSGTQLAATATISQNTWYHVVAVFDGSLPDTGAAPSVNHKMKIYINGILTYTRANGSVSTIVARASDFSIGHLYGNITSGWGGKLDEVAYYNYALAQSQVTKHYNASARHAVHSNVNLSVATWAHVAGSFNGTTGVLNLNVDGSNVNKTYAASAIANSTAPWTFGASDFSGTSESFWKGSFAEFRAYTRGLTSAELNACYSATMTKFP